VGEEVGWGCIGVATFVGAGAASGGVTFGGAVCDSATFDGARFGGVAFGGATFGVAAGCLGSFLGVAAACFTSFFGSFFASFFGSFFGAGLDFADSDLTTGFGAGGGFICVSDCFASNCMGISSFFG
jgi:hypothetical protein